MGGGDGVRGRFLLIGSSSSAERRCDEGEISPSSGEWPRRPACGPPGEGTGLSESEEIGEAPWNTWENYINYTNQSYWHWLLRNLDIHTIVYKILFPNLVQSLMLGLEMSFGAQNFYVNTFRNEKPYMLVIKSSLRNWWHSSVVIIIVIMYLTLVTSSRGRGLSWWVASRWARWLMPSHVTVRWRVSEWRITWSRPFITSCKTKLFRGTLRDCQFQLYHNTFRDLESIGGYKILHQTIARSICRLNWWQTGYWWMLNRILVNSSFSLQIIHYVRFLTYLLQMFIIFVSFWTMSGIT